MRNYFRNALAGLALVAAVPAMAATTIDFDDGTPGATVGATYAALGVTFTNASYSANFLLNGTSGTLAIVSSAQGFAFGADNPIIGTFGTGQSSVTIRGIDVGAAGVRLEAFDASNTLVDFAEFFGPGIGVGTFVDLGVAGSGITSFRVFQPGSTGGANAFGDGVLFEDLSFDGANAAVPEPATWAMMMLGFGMAGYGLRRRRKGVIGNRVAFL